MAVLALVGCTTVSVDPSPSAAPSVSTAATASVAPSATPTLTATPTPPPAAATTYTVVGGDTLYSLARRFGTTVQQLQAWNAERYPALARDAGVLEVGWVLVVAGEPGVTPAPTASPTVAPTPPPTGTGCTAGNRVAAGSAQTLAIIPNAGPGVALTFDMGGRMDPAVDIMSFLVANRVCATIFATGVMSETPQGEQVLAIIRDHPELFEIANHTMYHCDLV
ncbi:MAG: LysM peptidoglycan-binding domain-containing protein, partial [Chloroflexota bacterium]